MSASITREPWGRLPDDRAVSLYTLTNARGSVARIADYGAILQALIVPDRTGAMADVCLGFDSLEDYLDPGQPDVGVVVGRFANRIRGAAFELEGEVYRLAANLGSHHVHGGTIGFDKKLWNARACLEERGASIELSLVSPDMDEGYPGELQVSARYTLTDDDTLRIDYRGQTDKPTHVNMTHHAYFNLAGRGNILDHLLTLNADHTTEVDADLIPTGALLPVGGTPFDFRRPTAIGARIGDEHPQLRLGGGYDHTFGLSADKNADGLRHAATLADPASGREMQVWTSEPGVQLYTGNGMNSNQTGKGGVDFEQYGAVCLETQHYPDTPNRPDFPSTIVTPDKPYCSTTEFRFPANRTTTDSLEN